MNGNRNTRQLRLLTVLIFAIVEYIAATTTIGASSVLAAPGLINGGRMDHDPSKRSKRDHRSTTEGSTLSPSKAKTTNTAFLIPSQVVSSSVYKSKRPVQKRQQQGRSRELTSALLCAETTANVNNMENDGDDGGEDVIVYQGEKNQVKKKQGVHDIDQATEMLRQATIDKAKKKKMNHQQQKHNHQQTTTTTNTRKRTTQRKKVKMAKTGNLPDIHWRAIPMEHLRRHPSFEPLPEPSTIKELKNLEDVRFFRQDSWQWDALHDGRCTTSQACAALGLLEQRAGHDLGIPRSLRRGGMGAYHRLRGVALRSLEEMNEVLCKAGSGNGDYNGNYVEGKKNAERSVWERSRTNWSKINNQPTKRQHPKPFPFAAKYLPVVLQKELRHRKKEAKHHYLSHWAASPMIARMQWGNAQEATAILTALNYFWKMDAGIVIKEVGMCGAGLEMNMTESRIDGLGEGLIVGASPDAIIQYPNGTLEALEVKNHCPFVPLDWGSRNRKNKHQKETEESSDDDSAATNKNNSNNDKVFRIRELPIRPTVPPMYVPQLMMEMLCLGPSCRSVVMVRQTATIGAVILRLHRDDDWIEEMLYWLRRFMADFVHTETPPPPNFFWDNDSDESYGGGERYRKFVMRTKELGESVELVDFVAHAGVQRVMSEGRNPISLFLD